MLLSVPRKGAQPVDLTGRVFERLTVLERDPARGKARWICRCECGNVKSISGDGLKSGGTRSCGCLKREMSSARGLELSKHLKPKSSLPESQVGANALLALYQKGAESRNHTFDLTYEEFMDLLGRDCAYCGMSPSQVQVSGGIHTWFAYNGIDRIDNTKGYTRENTISCCKVCNRMKSSQTTEAFLLHVQKIYKHQNINTS